MDGEAGPADREARFLLIGSVLASLDVADVDSGVRVALSRVTTWSRGRLLLLLVSGLVLVVLWLFPLKAADAFGHVLDAIAEHPQAFLVGVSSLAGAASFVLSLFLWVDRRSGRKVREARIVSQWVAVKKFMAEAAEGPCLYVRNNSDRPIWDVRIEPEPYEADGDESAGTWAMIPPGETRESFWRFWPDESSGVRPTIRFVDDNGCAWRRDEFRLTHLGSVRDDIKTSGVDTMRPPRPMRRPRQGAGV